MIVTLSDFGTTTKDCLIVEKNSKMFGKPEQLGFTT
jgi:hypothetical protein